MMHLVEVLEEQSIVLEQQTFGVLVGIKSTALFPNDTHVVIFFSRHIESIK